MANTSYDNIVQVTEPVVLDRTVKGIGADIKNISDTFNELYQKLSVTGVDGVYVKPGIDYSSEGRSNHIAEKVTINGREYSLIQIPNSIRQFEDWKDVIKKFLEEGEGIILDEQDDIVYVNVNFDKETIKLNEDGSLFVDLDGGILYYNSESGKIKLRYNEDVLEDNNGSLDLVLASEGGLYSLCKSPDGLGVNYNKTHRSSTLIMDAAEGSPTKGNLIAEPVRTMSILPAVGDGGRYKFYYIPNEYRELTSEGSEGELVEKGLYLYSWDQDKYIPVSIITRPDDITLQYRSDRKLEVKLAGGQSETLDKLLYVDSSEGITAKSFIKSSPLPTDGNSNLLYYQDQDVGDTYAGLYVWNESEGYKVVGGHKLDKRTVDLDTTTRELQVIFDDNTIDVVPSTDPQYPNGRGIRVIDVYSEGISVKIDPLDSESLTHVYGVDAINALDARIGDGWNGKPFGSEGRVSTITDSVEDIYRILDTKQGNLRPGLGITLDSLGLISNSGLLEIIPNDSEFTTELRIWKGDSEGGKFESTLKFLDIYEGEGIQIINSAGEPSRKIISNTGVVKVEPDDYAAATQLTIKYGGDSEKTLKFFVEMAYTGSDGIEITSERIVRHTNKITPETTGIGSIIENPSSYEVLPIYTAEEKIITNLKYDAQGHITGASEGIIYAPIAPAPIWTKDLKNQYVWATCVDSSGTGIATSIRWDKVDYNKVINMPYSIDGYGHKVYLKNDTSTATGDINWEDLGVQTSIDLNSYELKTDLEKDVKYFLKPVAWTADYDDLINTPIMPTKVSELENDVPYLTAHQPLGQYVTKTEFVQHTGGTSEGLANHLQAGDRDYWNNKQDAFTAEKGIQMNGSGTTSDPYKLVHSNSVTANGFGSDTQIPTINYDAQGHVTSASGTTVYPPITRGTANQYFKSLGTDHGTWQTLHSTFANNTGTSTDNDATVALASSALYQHYSNVMAVNTTSHRNVYVGSTSSVSNPRVGDICLVPVS